MRDNRNNTAMSLESLEEIADNIADEVIKKINDATQSRLPMQKHLIFKLNIGEIIHDEYGYSTGKIEIRTHQFGITPYLHDKEIQTKYNDMLFSQENAEHIENIITSKVFQATKHLRNFSILVSHDRQKEKQNLPIEKEIATAIYENMQNSDVQKGYPFIEAKVDAVIEVKESQQKKGMYKIEPVIIHYDVDARGHNRDEIQKIVDTAQQDRLYTKEKAEKIADFAMLYLLEQQYYKKYDDVWKGFHDGQEKHDKRKEDYFVLKEKVRLQVAKLIKKYPTEAVLAERAQNILKDSAYGVLKYAHDMTRNDMSIPTDAIKTLPLLRFSPENICNNKDIVFRAVVEGEFCEEKPLKYASQELLNNKEFIIKAVSTDADALVDAETELKEDEDVLSEAGRLQDFQAIWYDYHPTISPIAKDIIDAAIGLRDQLIERETMETEFNSLSFKDKIGTKGTEIIDKIHNINHNLGLNKKTDNYDQPNGKG